MTYEIIRRNYERGLWNRRQVEVAVKAGVITQVQADEIYESRPATQQDDVGDILDIIEGGV